MSGAVAFDGWCAAAPNTRMISFDEFRQSLKHRDPPAGLPDLLEALWWDAAGDWERAHIITQDVAGPDAAWVHAYLHRKEGDSWNAGYWYSRSGRPRCGDTLEKEWEDLVRYFAR